MQWRELVQISPLMAPIPRCRTPVPHRPPGADPESIFWTGKSSLPAAESGVHWRELVYFSPPPLVRSVFSSSRARSAEIGGPSRPDRPTPEEPSSHRSQKRSLAYVRAPVVFEETDLTKT